LIDCRSFFELDFDLRSVNEDIDDMKIRNAELKGKNLRNTGTRRFTVPSQPALDGQHDA